MKQGRARQYFPLLLGLAVGLVGYYGPWVPHKAAGLVVTGLDLAEYVKFLPEVRSGAIQLQRETFYLPLFGASVATALLASRRDLPAWARVLLGLAAVPLALAMLPPAWSPATFTEAEFRLQVIAIAFCLLLLPGIWLTRHLPRRILLLLLAVLFVAAAIVPLWGFLQVQPAIADLYRQPLPLGWGVWANLLGFLAAAVAALAALMAREA